MNFEDIKNKMDNDKMDNISIPNRIEQLEKSKLPIQQVRKSMISEIISQLVFIVIFFAIPSLTEMYQLPQGIYYILMFVTSLITLMYLTKMSWFLNRTSSADGNSKDVVVAFIHDLQLTLEVYKTAIIAGSLLLPLSLITLTLGSKKADAGVFTKFITLDMSTYELTLSVIAYVVLAAIIYYITVLWADKLYGKHLKKLKTTLEEFSQ